MNVSLIIASRNRAKALTRALESLRKVKVPVDLEWELVLVDNASTDLTPCVMRRAAGLMSCPVTVVGEPRLGTPHAWNRGLSMARGRVIALADDDVTFGSDWLCSLHEAFSTREVEVVQGRIELDLPEPLPSWVERPWVTTFLGHFGQEESADHLVGGNFAARREAFERVGVFDAGMPDLWDTEFSRRLLKAGYRIHYVPGMSVLHHMPRSRFVAWRFIRQNYLWGKATPRLENTDLSLRRYARWLTKEALISMLAGSVSLAGGEITSALRHLCRFSSLVGTLRAIASRYPINGEVPKAAGALCSGADRPHDGMLQGEPDRG